tara:strand:- start:4750 stop:5097 length:348 start_codon:yes stop_codon:yes gene_type:complete
MRPWLILLNNFCHDLFTGLWFGSFVTIYVLRIKAAELGAPGPWLEQLNSFFFAFCWISLLLVCLTGLFRFLFDRHGDGGIGKHNWQVKKQMLIVKHAVLGIAFVGGSWLIYLWTH